MSHGRERPIARLQRMLLMFSLEGRVDWELIIAKTRSNTCYSTPYGPENEKKTKQGPQRSVVPLRTHANYTMWRDATLARKKKMASLFTTLHRMKPRNSKSPQGEVRSEIKEVGLAF